MITLAHRVEGDTAIRSIKNSAKTRFFAAAMTLAVSDAAREIICEMNDALPRFERYFSTANYH